MPSDKVLYYNLVIKETLHKLKQKNLESSGVEKLLKSEYLWRPFTIVSLVKGIEGIKLLCYSKIQLIIVIQVIQLVNTIVSLQF